jgi:hypothetical protein
MEQMLLMNAYNAEFVDVNRPIPEELDFLIVHAPQADYSVDTIGHIGDWLNNDGMFGRTLLYFADTSALTPNIDSFLEDWGIAVERAFVEQRDSRFTAPIMLAGMPIHIQYFAPQQFEEGLNPAFRIFGDMMRYTRPLWEYWTGVQTTIRTTPILSSHPGAVVRPFEFPREEFDYASAETGAFEVGVHSSMERYIDGQFDPVVSHVLVFGGTNVFSEVHLNRTNANNVAFLLNMMNELSGWDLDVPMITPRSFEIPMFEVTQEQAELLGVIFAVVLPLLLIITGVVIWIKRIRS